MRGLLVIFALIFSVSSLQKEWLETNRVPSQIDNIRNEIDNIIENFSDTCTECKTILHNLINVVDDPKKLAELKIVLGALCHETSYVEECKLFISKMDIFIKRLEPFLKDTEAVCKKMRLCSNSRLTFFHQAGLIFIKKQVSMNLDSNAEAVSKLSDFMCDECQLATMELKKAVDNEQERKQIQKFISENICKKIRKYSGSCDLMVEQFLPELFEELDNLLKNPKQTCAALGFCPATTVGGPANKVAELLMILQDD